MIKEENNRSGIKKDNEEKDMETKEGNEIKKREMGREGGCRGR